MNPDTLPSSKDLAGPCPNCGRISSFTLEAGAFTVGKSHKLFIIGCQGCGNSTAVIEKFRSGPQGVQFEPVHWWPVPGAGQLDQAVPARVAEAYDEGMRCLAVRAPRAAVVMFRSLLSFLVEDKGSDEAKAQRGLKGKLRQMSTDGTLHPSLAQWAETVRDIGNGGAHPDELPEPDLDQANELARLCRSMIEVVYEIDARILRARSPA